MQTTLGDATSTIIKCGYALHLKLINQTAFYISYQKAITLCHGSAYMAVHKYIQTFTAILSLIIVNHQK